jgi:bacterioferritin (cytochrome b1)
MGESTDSTALAAALNRALPLVARDALALATAAGTLPGPEGVALGAALRDMAVANLRDVERLATRIASLGGAPALAVEEPRVPKGWAASVKRLLADGQATLEALVDAIPADADDAEGEATEHLLEHIVARKREDLELLQRAAR